MANTVIQIKRSGISGNIPDPSSINYGELSLNYNDGYLFYKDNLGQIQKIFSSDSFSSVSVNSSLLLASSPYDVLSINSTYPVQVSGNVSTDTITIGVDYASTSHSGVVQISDNFNSTNTSLVSSANVANTLHNQIVDLTISPYTKEPTGIYDISESVIQFTNSDRRFTISAVSNTFTLFCRGTKYNKVTDSVVIPNTTGLYYISYDDAGTLSYKTTFFNLSQEAPIAYVYWNATLGSQQFFADERHGITMDWATHEYLHRTRGAAIASGFGISYNAAGTGSANSDLYVDITSGTFFDEDIKVQIVDSASPTPNTWQQILSGPAQIPMFYLQNSGEWKLDTATNFPMTIINQTPQYNLFANSTWNLENVVNNTHFVTFILASNNLTHPVFGIIDQSAKNTIDEARAQNFVDLYLPGFPVVEFRPLYKLIFQHKSIYTNAAKCVLVEVQDIRSISPSLPAVAMSVSSHSQLTGLGNDDHTQYVHNSIARTITATHTFNPSANGAPFSLGLNSQGQLVSGLNSDLLDGFDSTHFIGLSTSAHDQANTGLSVAQSAFNQANTKVFIFYQNTAPTSSNSHDMWINNDTGIVYENFGSNTSPIWAEFGPNGVSSNTTPAVITISSILFSDNSIQNTAASPIVVTQASYNQANLAYSQANTAYATANLKFNSSGGTISGAVIINSSLTISDNVSSSSTTQNVFNTTATTINFAGAATSLNIGASSGTTSINNILLMNYVGNGGGSLSSINVNGYNSRGGTGYHDFLKVTNGYSSATTPSKFFRLSSSGALEILNNAYNTQLFTLSDAGILNVYSQYQVNGKQAVNGPAFSAYASNATLQTIPTDTLTKVLFQIEEFDTNNNYTNSTFTPTVAGYYQINSQVRIDGTSGTGEMMIALYKNGAAYKRGTNQQGTQIASNFWAMQVSSLVYANGTTDYFEIYVQQGSAANRTVTAVNDTGITWFNGAMVRGA